MSFIFTSCVFSQADSFSGVNSLQVHADICRTAISDRNTGNTLDATMTCTYLNSSDDGLDLTPSYDVTCSSNASNYDRFVTVLQTTIVSLISSGIVLSNIVNLIVLVSASAAMPWATRLFLINLSSSDLLVGLVACAPAVLPAATDRWTYGGD